MECFPSPRRLPQGKKIWEIESCYKCSLIGTYASITGSSMNYAMWSRPPLQRST